MYITISTGEPDVPPYLESVGLIPVEESEDIVSSYSLSQYCQKFDTVVEFMNMKLEKMKKKNEHDLIGGDHDDSSSLRNTTPPVRNQYE